MRFLCASREALRTDSSFLAGLPVELGRLTALTALQVSRNALRGTLPDSLWGLSSLTYLGLDFNEFTGTVSASVARLTALDTLYALHHVEPAHPSPNQELQGPSEESLHRHHPGRAGRPDQAVMHAVGH